MRKSRCTDARQFPCTDPPKGPRTDPPKDRRPDKPQESSHRPEPAEPRRGHAAWRTRASMPSAPRSRKLAERFLPRVFRQRVLVATAYHRQFEPRRGCRRELATTRANCVRVRDAANFPACESRPRRGMASSLPVRSVLRVPVQSDTYRCDELSLVGARTVRSSSRARRAISASGERALRAVETLSTWPREIDWHTPRDCVPGP